MQTVLIFVAVVAINSLAVYTQRKNKFYTNLFGQYDWAAHTILLSIIWGLFIFSLIVIKPPNWGLSATLKPLGVLIGILGTYMVLSAWTRLGTMGTLNGYFFGRGPKKELKSGVFRFQNPMYIGFALLFTSIGFWLGNAFYLFMAALSFVLLNIIQSRFENPSK